MGVHYMELSVVGACVLIILTVWCFCYHLRRKRKARELTTDSNGFAVRPDNLACYNPQGNPMMLSPNLFFVPNEMQNLNIHPPPYELVQQVQNPPSLLQQLDQPQHTILELQPRNTIFEDFQIVALNAHNTYRAQHSSPPMTLDKDLNQAAQDCAIYYAHIRAIDHSCVTAGVGENLYAVWGGSGSLNFSIAVNKAIQVWYDEKATYNFENPERSTGVTGHFTQLVWKESTLLGVGAATINGYTAIVAKYKKHGNITLGGINVDKWKFYKENVVVSSA